MVKKLIGQKSLKMLIGWQDVKYQNDARKF